jgi:hypothetical protein
VGMTEHVEGVKFYAQLIINSGRVEWVRFWWRKNDGLLRENELCLYWLDQGYRIQDRSGEVFVKGW